jgi:uroporphyrinogen III methyltransferase/synthase
VVRLKGGDPYLFGRGAEEAAYLARHGIECEVVPGVTSGIAAPAAAGIPVTHRDLASSVTFVTGHEDPGKGEAKLDYKAIAGMIAASGTVCFYMGVGRLAAISASLIGHGLPGNTPVAVVQWGGTGRQRSVRTTLEKADADVTAAGLGAPAIIVVGAVAAIDEPGLDWFTRRPLFGVRVLVTRTRQQASGLRQQLDELGAETFEAPTIELVPPVDPTAFHVAVDALCKHGFDWLVLTSANGVEALAARMRSIGVDARALHGLKIAAVGDATAEALTRMLGVRADFIPERSIGEALAHELLALDGAKHTDGTPRRFLLLRADIARPALPKLLREAGADVTEAIAYETRIASGLPADVTAALEAHEIDWITFTSASTANNLVQLLGEKRALLNDVKIASIGPITSDAVRALGLRVSVESRQPDIAGLIAAIVAGV